MFGSAGGLVVICLLMWFLFVKVLSTPSVGTISYPKPSSAQTTSFNMTPVSVKGQYSSFAYPKSFSVARSSKLVPPTLADYEFAYKSAYSADLSISVLDISGGNLDANNAYQFRKVHPNNYTESSLEINGSPVIVMADKTTPDFSKVAFLVNNRYQATVSLTAYNGSSIYDPAKIFNQVLTSWKWAGQ